MDRAKWKTVIIPRELANEIDDLVESGDALTLGFTNKSQIITASVRAFLKDSRESKINIVAKSRMDNELLDLTIVGRFPKCNECGSFDCSHIDKFFKEKEILSKLKKEKGVLPIRLEISEEQTDKKVIQSVKTRK